MAPDPYLRILRLPELRKPFLLAAFAGWNDAGQVATHALMTLVNGWKAEVAADIDPEEFFDFTESRPLISLDSDGQRSLDWPTNVFYGHALPEQEHDVLLLVGTEPQLRWRTFCRTILGVAAQMDACCLVTLGGLLADVPHTIEPRLTGFVNGGESVPSLQRLGMRASSYEGPTGVVGVLHDAWRGTGKPSVSLWGNVPHYISASPNPPIALALLRRLASVLGTEVPLGSLKAQEAAFKTQVEEALAHNAEAMEYVRELEAHFSEEPPPPASGKELIAELEEFLRGRRPEEDESP
jgi:proteasome assembly chaperone (PAC2) family protein